MKRIPIDIVRTEEAWSTAFLPDGTKVRVKLVFLSVERETDESGAPAFAPDGNPLLQCKFNWIVDVDAPPAARKPKVSA